MRWQTVKTVWSMPAMRWVLGLLAALLAVWLLLPRPPLLEGFSYSRAVTARDGTLLRLSLAGDGQYRLPVRLGEVPPELIQATLRYEDRHFHWHPGVNPLALARALWNNLRGGRTMGASTLSMQVARLAHGLRTRSVGGKLWQMLRAVQLERHYSKEEILAAYFTLAPYGYNIQGVAAASRIYFNKTPAELSLAEMLALSVIPQHPNQRAPVLPTVQYGDAPPNPALDRARARQGRRWLANHPRDTALLGPGGAPPLRLHGFAGLPFAAPHLVRHVLAGPLPPLHIQGGGNPTARTGRHDAGTDGAGNLRTTLDVTLHNLLETRLEDHLRRNGGRGLHNAAAMLVEHGTMAVRAMVGSGGFHREDIAGQVNGMTARRSPGSALKPFLFALAMEQGLIHPRTVLKDAPRGYGLYDPENFDGEFMGPITATEALVRSRNVPALWLAAQITPGFHGFLLRAGIAELQPAGFYGLPIVLGGAEVTGAEMAGLYAMLANGGRLRPLRFLEGAPTPEGEALLTPEAAWLTLDMLRQNPPPRGEAYQGWLRGRRPIAWKTGTSHGFRDAWAAGVIGPYVLVVWVGNFNGQAHPSLIGRTAAGPLFFAMADALRPHTPEEEPTEPPADLRLQRVTVCAASGGIPGPHCPVTAGTWFITGVSPITPDTVFREIAIDTRSGLRACPGEEAHVTRRIYAVWPTDLLRVFREAGIPRQVPPPYPVHCAPGAGGGRPPRITSPRAGLVYAYQPGSPGMDGIPLDAVTEGDVRTLYWYLDTRYLGHSTPHGQPYIWQPTPGRHTLRAVDDQGRSHAIPVTITTLGQ